MLKLKTQPHGDNSVEFKITGKDLAQSGRKGQKKKKRAKIAKDSESSAHFRKGCKIRSFETKVHLL